MWQVFRQSLGITFWGVAAGVLGALAAGRVLVRLVEWMQPGELSAFAITIPLLVAAALLASFVPARPCRPDARIKSGITSAVIAVR